MKRKRWTPSARHVSPLCSIGSHARWVFRQPRSIQGPRSDRRHRACATKSTTTISASSESRSRLVPWELSPKPVAAGSLNASGSDLMRQGFASKHRAVFGADSRQVPQHHAHGDHPRRPPSQSLSLGRSSIARLQQPQNAFRSVKAKRKQSDEKKILICLLVLGFGSWYRLPRNSGMASFLTRPTTTTHCFATTSSSSTLSTAAELRESHRATQPCPADGPVRQKHARSYRAIFSQWRNVTSLNTFGNTVSWINGINTGVLPNINTGYLKATTPLSQYDPFELSGMDASELGRVQSQYASSNSWTAQT